MYLSEITVSFTEDNVNIQVSDVNNDIIFDSGVKKKSLRSYNFSTISEISGVVKSVLNQHTTTDRGGRIMGYSQNQPYIGDGAIPAASDYFEDINELSEIASENKDIDIDTSDYEEVRENLFNGLLMRITSVVENSVVLVGSISNLVDNTSHVGPLRRSPQRVYSASEAHSSENYFKRINIEDRIFDHSDQEISPVLKETNKWLKKTGFDCKLEPRRVGVGDIFQLRVNEGDISVNLADSGFGLSQTLPVIIECMNMNLNSKNPTKRDSPLLRRRYITQHLTIIEEPEIHLNPKIEAKIGDFFLDIGRSDTGVLVETHSEHIINRIQRRIAEGTAESDSVVVYFVEKEDSVTNIRKIDIDEDGSFEHWPDGFFQEDLDDAIEILKNRAQREDQ